MILSHQTLFPGSPIYTSDFSYIQWFPLVYLQTWSVISLPALFFSPGPPKGTPNLTIQIIFLTILLFLVNVITVHPGDKARNSEFLLDASFGLDVHIQLVSKVCSIPILHNFSHSFHSYFYLFGSAPYYFLPRFHTSLYPESHSFLINYQRGSSRSYPDHIS